ncbi:MAG: sulfurtransferase [Acidimicrobiia bacterium]
MSRPTISVEELRLGLDELALFDLRWSLTDPAHGIASYREEHIPGAVFVDLDNDLSAPHGDGRHPLPSAPDFTKTLGRLGITPDDEVVVYDDVGGAVAARMWWMLRSIGHDHVSLLDGGMRAWRESGLDVETSDVLPTPTTYPPAATFRWVLGHDQLAHRTIVDVRAPERYRGDREPVDPKAGHIPGALNLPMAGNLGEDGRFLSEGQLNARFASLPDDVVFSCGSGVNACHSALAMNLAGRPMPDVYIGSFSDWSRRDLPVKTGDEP